MSAPSPVLRTEHCERCGIECNIELIESVTDSVPSFFTTLWPDSVWIGWSWSGEQRDKLALVLFCSQVCLVQWFADRPEPPASLPPPSPPPSVVPSFPPPIISRP